MLKIAYYELKKLLRDTRWIIIFTMQPVILMVLLGLVAFYEPKDITFGVINKNDNKYSDEFIDEIKKEDILSIKTFDSEEILRNELSQDKLRSGLIVDIKDDGYVSGSVEFIENSTVPELSAKAKEKIAKIYQRKVEDYAKDNVQTNIDDLVSEKKDVFEKDKNQSINSLKNKISDLGLPALITDQFNKAVNDVEIKADFDSGDNTGVPKVELVESKNTTRDLKYFDFYASAIIILLTIMIALKAADTSITEERMTGTFERFFVTPYRKYHMIFGKMIAFTAIDLFLAMIIVFTMATAFDVNLGSYLLVFSIAFISALAAASLGLLISCITYTIPESIQVSNLIFFSFLILTGLLFQPESMHPVVKSVSSFLPFTFLIKATREVNLLNLTFIDVWPKLLVGIGFVFIFLFSASLLLKRKAN